MKFGVGFGHSDLYLFGSRIRTFIQKLLYIYGLKFYIFFEKIATSLTSNIKKKNFPSNRI